MPKEHFQLKQITNIPPLTPGQHFHIHLIGVCGVAMGQLAIALKRQGYKISGSDKEFYEPMGSLLQAAQIKIFNGYKSGNVVEATPDLVVIGNAISYENPEVQEVEAKNLPYTCFPQALYECLIQGKHSIVVAGTHGKSTTTSLTAHILQKNNLKPSFFVGGVLNSSDSSFTVQDGKVSVVEGDEYDSAFFAKTPKFSFYRANTLIINALEFDHADIYQNLDAIDREFIKEIERLEESDLLIYSADDQHLRSLIKKCKKRCQAMSFGLAEDAALQITKREPNNQGQRIEFLFQGNIHEANLPAPGIYNARNLAAACLACLKAGLSMEEICTAAESFTSVKRRFERRLDSNKVTIIEDFAHHPTAIKEAIQATRETFPSRRILAVFEPRSNTSRRAAFHNEYIEAFKNSDGVYISAVIAKPNEENLELLDTHKLCQDLQGKNVCAKTLDSADKILSELCSDYKQGDVLLIMSNGSFGGIIQQLVEHFKKIL